jgi:leucyl aminopeptidase
MRFEVIAKDIITVPCDVAVVNLFEGVKIPSGGTGAVDRALDGQISAMIATGEITGKLNEVTLIHTFNRIQPKRVIVIGLGKPESFTLDRVRQVAAASIRAAKKVKAVTIATITHGAGIGGLDPESAAKCLAEGSILADFTFNEFKSDPQDTPAIQQVWVTEITDERRPMIEKGILVGTHLADMTNYARYLTTLPSNHLTPTIFAARASELAQQYQFECIIYDEKDLEDMAMQALLGVGKGSVNPPRLVVLKYLGAPESNDITAMVGKGMTFDSGGISIKPADGMEAMKDDMGGAAAVLCAVCAVAHAKLKINLIVVCAMAENMPSGTAQKPGDIVKTFSGKTIEVLNTDAEGRLILADAVAYAHSLGVSRVIDIATLTGSVVVALGHEASGYISTNDTFSDLLMQAADQSGEKVWRMPIFDEYKEYLKSDIADFKNVGGRPAGMITGGLLIGAFAGDLPWIHVDIGGTVWSNKELPYIAKGATGVGVRTLYHLAESLTSKE